MIIGLGIDLVHRDRIARILKRHDHRFLSRIYTRHEQEVSQFVGDRVGYLAKRWAAKEACSKALGTGLRQGVFWKAMEVRSCQGGMPVMVVQGGALEHLQKLTPAGHRSRIHLTMSDDHPMAAAQVIIEAIRE